MLYSRDDVFLNIEKVLKAVARGVAPFSPLALYKVIKAIKDKISKFGIRYELSLSYIIYNWHVRVYIIRS